MFSCLSASHSISPHLAPENCKDLAFFPVNGFLKARAWFSSTVNADLMGYYSCSKTGNKNRKALKASEWEKKVTCLKQKWEKEENEKYESMFTFVFFSEEHWFQWKIELTGLPVSPAEQAAAAEGGHLIIFGMFSLYYEHIHFKGKSFMRHIQQYTVASALTFLHAH